MWSEMIVVNGVNGICGLLILALPRVLPGTKWIEQTRKFGVCMYEG